MLTFGTGASGSNLFGGSQMAWTILITRTMVGSMMVTVIMINDSCLMIRIISNSSKERLS